MTTSRPRRRALNPQRFTLENGLRVLLVENHELPTVSMNLTVLAGGRTDPEEHAGIATMACRLLDEGTESRTALEIAEAIESVGGSVDCDNSHDRTTTYLSVLSKDLDLGIDLMVDVVTRPAFEADSVANERERILAEIRSAMDRPQLVASWEFNELVYRGHPLHRPVHGYPETIARIERDHLHQYHSRHFHPGNAILSAVGDFNAEDLVRKLESAFIHWAPTPVPPQERSAPERQTDHRSSTLPLEAEQAHVYFGHLGIARAHPDFYTLQVMDAILGGGAGLTSRIPRKLRDEQGLAYTTYAGITGSAGMEPGKFVAYIGTAPENIDRAIAGFIEEVERIRTEPVTAEELDDAKAYLTGSFVFGFESNSQIARFLINAEVFGLGFDHVEKYPEYIELITADDITRASREHLSTEEYSVVIAGPANKLSAPK